MRIQFDYKLSLGAYRKMYYFNALFSKKMQSLFIVLAWIAAVTLLLLENLEIINRTRVMHLCFLLVSVSLPVLIFSI